MARKSSYKNKSPYVKLRDMLRGANFFHNERYWESADYNSRAYRTYLHQVTALAVNRYRWINLPPSCDARFLELTLLYRGQATIAFPRKQPGIFYSTQATYESRPNIYGYPSKWRSIGTNGWQFDVTPANGVFIFDNSLRYPIFDALDWLARELADVARTMQVNRFHQKIPLVITGGNDKKLDLTNIAKQVGGGEPMLIGYDSLDDIGVQALTDKPAPFIGTELIEAQKYIWQQVYDLLGIPNLTFKSERVIEDEVSTLEAPSNIQLLDGLQERRKAAKRLNERFGKYLPEPIDVVFNTDYESGLYNDMRQVSTLLEMQGGESNVEAREIQ